MLDVLYNRTPFRMKNKLYDTVMRSTMLQGITILQ